MKWQVMSGLFILFYADCERISVALIRGQFHMKFKYDNCFEGDAQFIFLLDYMLHVIDNNILVLRSFDVGGGILMMSLID
jgi:hypothetical protein